MSESASSPSPPRVSLRQAFAQHPRLWRDFQYVYPVVSRRSKGLSIGINVNIDKACNFDCIYCCVDRSVPPPRGDVDLDQIDRELTAMLDLAASGAVWTQPPFDAVGSEYRRLNDIAFSGDGEPSTFAKLDQAVARVAAIKDRRGLRDVKIILVSNATGFERPATRRALALLDQHQGEVWAKLDAGTHRYYQLVDRTRMPLEKVLANILACGRERTIVIQSLFMRVHDQPPPVEEFEAYLDRLRELREAGCRISLVQLYTVARRTAESYVTPLSDAELDALGRRCGVAIPDLPVKVYYGVG